MRTASLKLAAGLCAALTLSACNSDDDGPAPGGGGGGAVACAGEVFALTSSNQLISFDAATPGTVTSAAISGLAAGDAPVGLDFRPDTQELFLLTNNAGVGKLYSVLPTGAATLAATLNQPLDGTHFAMDFNPVSDRLRVLGVGGSTPQNISVNPGTGNVSPDTALTDTGLPAPRVVAAAYTNSIQTSSTVLGTALYGIDAESNRLVRIGLEPATDGVCPDAGNPECGNVTNAGSALGVDVGDDAAFDIDPATGVGCAAIHANGATSSTLYSVDLDEGTIAGVGTIGGGEAIKGLTLTAAYEAIVYGVSATNKLVSFRPGTPGTLRDVTPGTITVPLGVEVVGADFRPIDGQLYALGDDGFLYTVKLDSPGPGTATKVGSSIEPPVFTGSAFGVDFNARSDSLRVISEADENLRFDADDGNDRPLEAPVTPAGDIAAIAIDRNFVGASGVTKYGIDTTSNKLVTIGESTSTSGVVTELAGGGALGVNPASTCAGFDIAGGRDGLVLAALDIGGTSTLHRIDLSSGVATPLGAIGGGEKVCSLSIQLLPLVTP